MLYQPIMENRILIGTDTYSNNRHTDESFALININVYAINIIIFFSISSIEPRFCCQAGFGFVLSGCFAC